ncbi:MAG: 3-methyl-2-oxobutanoate hydroxymethyltransferase, partial [Candidatus Thermochlorobacter aerophilum]
RRYANLEQIISDAVRNYVADVKRKDFQMKAKVIKLRSNKLFNQ